MTGERLAGQNSLANPAFNAKGVPAIRAAEPLMRDESAVLVYAAECLTASRASAPLVG
jgi:hypothetical protein